MAVIIETEAGKHTCPWNNFEPCQGIKCMAWARHGRSHEYMETDNLIETPEGIRPDDLASPQPPTAQGWKKDGAETSKGYHRSAKDDLPKGRSQRWVREIPRTTGHCARDGHGDCGGMR